MEHSKAIEEAHEANRNLDLIDDAGDRIKLVVESQVGIIVVDASFVRSINDTEAIAICQDRIVVVNKNVWTVVDTIIDLKMYNK